MKRTIQQLREDHGESRMQLADALQVTLDDVSDWELGQAEPGLSNVRALAEHFDVSENDLELVSVGDRARDR
jgi:transcriptional regulator with XRE-family HTH domain